MLVQVRGNARAGDGPLVHSMLNPCAPPALRNADNERW